MHSPAGETGAFYGTISFGDAAIADEGAGDADEGLEVLRLALVTAVHASTSVQPGHRALDHPAVSAQPVGCFELRRGTAGGYMEQALNKRQQAVLDWVGHGCPDGVWPDSTYKTSGQALQNRGLIKITKRRGHWSAHLTEKGRQHLIERGIRPVEQSTRPPERPARKPAPRRPRAAPKALANYADQLLEELAAANDGSLIKPIESGPHAVNWASRVNAARKSGKIPHTQELHGYRTHRGYEITLVDIPPWRLAELTPLHVPARLSKPHAVVNALQKQRSPWA